MLYKEPNPTNNPQAEPESTNGSVAKSQSVRKLTRAEWAKMPNNRSKLAKASTHWSNTPKEEVDLTSKQDDYRSGSPPRCTSKKGSNHADRRI